MKTLKSLALVFGVGLFLLSTSLRADEWDKKTIITFSGPVQVANTQLPAGTYVFKLADTTDRQVVQIFNQDETHVYATILATPDYRLEPADKTVIKFAESSAGSESSGIVPESGMPIKEWFYPGDSFGSEFRVAPQQIAAIQPEPAAAPAPPAESPEAAAPAEPQPAPEAAAPVPQEQITPVTPAATPQTEPVAEPQAAPAELPQTASQMPLVGLIGALALAAAASLRIFLKISA